MSAISLSLLSLALIPSPASPELARLMSRTVHAAQTSAFGALHSIDLSARLVLEQQEPVLQQQASVLDVSADLEKLRAASDLPGMACMAVRNGKLVGFGVAGVRSVKTKEKIEIDDPFHMGSCTKAMTSTLAAVLIEQGKLSWGTTIADGLPKLAKDFHPRYHDVTIELLLRHQGGIAERANPQLSGLVKKFPALKGTPVEQRREIASMVLKGAPTKPIGKGMEYSNYGYMTAAAILERISGRSWEELMVAEVFKPMGLKSAAIGSPPGKHHPVGHQKKDGKWQALDLGPGGQLPECMSPAGLVHMNLRDWATFVTQHIQGHKGSDKGLISSKSFRRLHTDTGKSGYVAGWGIGKRPWAKGEIWTHAGSDGTWFSVVWAAPKLDLVLLAVSNSGTVPEACHQAVGKLREGLKIH